MVGPVGDSGDINPNHSGLGKDISIKAQVAELQVEVTHLDKIKGSPETSSSLTKISDHLTTLSNSVNNDPNISSIDKGIIQGNIEDAQSAIKYIHDTPDQNQIDQNGLNIALQVINGALGHIFSVVKN